MRMLSSITAVLLALATPGCEGDERSEPTAKPTQSTDQREPTVRSARPAPTRKAGDDKLAEKLAALEAAASSDVFGPMGAASVVSIRVEKDWQTCRRDDECTEVYSGCSVQKVVVNKTAVDKVRAAWKQACGDRPATAVMAARAKLVCRRSRCREDLDARFKGLEAADGWGLSPTEKQAKQPDKTAKKPPGKQ